MHRTVDGRDGLEAIRSSRWRPPAEPTEIVFYAEAGVRYAIALGVGGSGQGGDFELTWSEAETPIWLRYAGRVAPGGYDSAGRTVDLHDLGAMAFNGPALYVGSGLGLLVFERDPVGGSLALHQVLGGGVPHDALIWDWPRGRLLGVRGRCKWRQLAPFDGGLRLAEPDELIIDGTYPCAGPNRGVVFADSTFSSLYRVNRGLMHVFAVDAGGDIRVVRGDFHLGEGYYRGLIAHDDSHVYVLAQRSVVTFQRDAESGDLTRVDGMTFPHQLGSIAISQDGAYMAVVESRGERTDVLGLEDPAHPVIEATLDRFWPITRHSAGYVARGCHSVPGRSGAFAFDAVCDTVVFAVDWRPAKDVLLGSDYAIQGESDRDNNLIPDFGVPASVAASPDGRHVYVATVRHGILIFERIGAGVIDPAAVETTASAPLVPAASDATREGFVRIINHSKRAGEVRIAAVDDRGDERGAQVLRIGANRTMHLNSGDLESGNETKGLAAGAGSGDGDWRLALRSDLVIEALSYLRTDDGFLTSMHDHVPTDGGEHRVRIFNPGSNTNQASRLRLVNPADEDASIRVSGIDDHGASPGTAVTLAVPAGAARTVHSWELESGAEGLAGSLGDGAGKWQLIVDAEQPILVMNLLASPTGHLANLSTVAPKP